MRTNSLIGTFWGWQSRLRLQFNSCARSGSLLLEEMAGKTVVALLLLALVVAASAVSTQKAVARKRDIMVNQAIAQAPSSLPPSVTCPICTPLSLS